MSDPIRFTRRIRRVVDRAGLSANIAADVNIVVSSGGSGATSRQCAPTRQERPDRAAAPAAPENKEQP